METETETQYCEDCANYLDEEFCKARPVSTFIKRDAPPEYYYTIIIRGTDPICPNGFKPKE